MGSQFGSQFLFASGVFNGESSESHRARIPAPFAGVAPLLGAELRGTALDFERGAVEQIFSWAQGEASAVQRTYFHQALQHVVVTELEVDNTGGASALTVHLSDPFDLRIRPLFQANGSEDVRMHITHHNGSMTCVNGSTIAEEAAGHGLLTIALCRANPAAAYTVSAGQITHIQLLASLWTNLDPLPLGVRSPLEAAVAEYASLSLLSPGRLYTSHCAAMQELWQGSIEVEGNADLARNVRSSWWNLLLSYRPDQNMSSSPGGLANDCYKGHSFWDVEQFMWPNLLLFHPRLAAGALQYRYDRRRAAAMNAASHKHAGLQYPWESAITGQEVCSWNPGIHEIHINGDVSLAFWQYWQATGDKQWLRSVGWPVLSGIADFWASRAVVKHDGSGLLSNSHRQFEIRDVVDVDEHAQHVKNSGYTNAVARLSLQNAAKAAELIRRHANSSWLAIADGLPIPFDPAHLRHPEYETAKAGSGLGVILMQYPLAVPSEWGMTQEVRANDLAFYEHQKKIANALYWWVFAIGWLGLDKPESAEEYFHRSTVRNVFGPFHIWTELPNGEGCPNFVTGAGAYLQILWAGYGGIRLTDDGLAFRHPRVPPNATGLRLNGLAYKGGTVDVRITARNISLQIRTAPPDGQALRATHSPSMRSVTLDSPNGDPTTFPSQGIVTITLQTAEQLRKRLLTTD
jgi:trehalose/maltose hydrolase-like predicted phosphorylase